MMAEGSAADVGAETDVMRHAPGPIRKGSEAPKQPRIGENIQ